MNKDFLVDETISQQENKSDLLGKKRLKEENIDEKTLQGKMNKIINSIQNKYILLRLFFQVKRK